MTPQTPQWGSGFRGPKIVVLIFSESKSTQLDVTKMCPDAVSGAPK